MKSINQAHQMLDIG